ncbi:MAG: LytTR family transcriptional regulator DNA-binding domain-containing protein [Cyclobacteriaceae bacterium]|nr:LytTR family transcriptional regulator DNA-binding domain-containing protein [Cyclobacteriaceae bacterium]
MKDWLQKPFPFVSSLKQSLGIGFFIGIFVTLFLYIFKPFGIVDDPSHIVYLSGYGIIAFGVAFLSLQILTFVKSDWFNPNTWNILKNIVLMCWILLVVSFFNWLYALYIFETLGAIDTHFKEVPTKLLENVGMTFSVGIFPILIINYILEKRFFIQNLRIAKAVETTMDNTSTILANHTTFEMPIDSNELAIIPTQNLIAAKAEGGNYITVFWLEQDKLKDQLWRSTLKNLLDKTQTDKDILQCHKSFLVNRSYIKEVTGNARTLALRLKRLEFEVPVSRNFPRELVTHYHLKQA